MSLIFITSAFGNQNIIKMKKKWTYETCYEEAKKYNTKGDFRIGSSGAYSAALKNKWLKDYTWFVSGYAINGKKQIKWNKETCFEEAKKYKTKTEFQNGNNSAYNAAWKKGWLDDYYWFEEIRKPNGYWTYDTCYQEARKYKTKTDFKKGKRVCQNEVPPKSWTLNTLFTF